MNDTEGLLPAVTSNDQIMKQMRMIRLQRLLQGLPQEKKQPYSPMIGVRAEADEYVPPMRGFPWNTVAGGSR